MQLTEIVQLVAAQGIKRYAEKRGGFVLPFAVGTQLPGIAERALERAHTSEKTFERAEGQKVAAGVPYNPRTSPFQDMLSNVGQHMTGGAHSGFGELGASPLKGVASGISGGIGESIKRMMLGREFGDRKDPLHLGGGAAIQTFGKGVGEMGVDLLRDMAAKAVAAAGHAGDSAARNAILGDLRHNDPVLADANDKVLMEAYHTMTRFAPTLSTDKNAVRSFLRQAVMSGSGPDYMSIKLLADSERSVTGGGDKGGH